MPISKIVITKTCPVCGTDHTVEVDPVAYGRWKAGAFIQDAFPDMPKDQREILMTGIDQACWDRMFADE